MGDTLLLRITSTHYNGLAIRSGISGLIHTSPVHRNMITYIIPYFHLTHIHKGPLRREGNTINRILDRSASQSVRPRSSTYLYIHRHGEPITLYREIPQILHRLKFADVTIAACSRTCTPKLWGSLLCWCFETFWAHTLQRTAGTFTPFSTTIQGRTRWETDTSNQFLRPTRDLSWYSALTLDSQ